MEKIMKGIPVVYSDLISATIVLYVWIRIYSNATLDVKAVRLFRNIGITLFATLVADHLWEYVYERYNSFENARRLLNTIASIGFLCIPVSIFFLIMYHRDHLDLPDCFFLAADGVLFLANLLNIWIPVYSYTDKGLYMVNAPGAKWVYPLIIILLSCILTHDFLIPNNTDAENRIMIIFTGLIAALGAASCYLDGDVVAVWECFAIVYLLLYLALVRAFDKTDQVTGLPNRNAFTLAFFRRRRKEAGLLVSFDLNHLKHFNDEEGHQTGDQYLRAFAQTADKKLAFYGRLYRVGGDEFCLVSRDDPEMVKAALEELSRMEKCDPEYGDYPLDFAYGIAAREPGETNESLYERADAIMYENKRQTEEGRSRI
jgi:diguanylate cyclase (GGDEF)-like protein